jgi:hypothetical protein
MTFGALSIVCTGHKKLLGVIANKISQNWITAVP